MLKNAYFFGKIVKIASAPPVCPWRLGAPPSDTRIITSAYYYHFTLAQNAFQKMKKLIVNIPLLLGGRGKNSSCTSRAQGTLVTLLAASVS